MPPIQYSVEFKNEQEKKAWLLLETNPRKLTAGQKATRRDIISRMAKVMKAADLEDIRKRRIRDGQLQRKAFQAEQSRLNRKAHARRSYLAQRAKFRKAILEAQVQKHLEVLAIRRYNKRRKILMAAQQQAREDAQDHGLVALNPEEGTDVVRDIKFVYEHLGKLFVTDTLGVRHLDPRISSLAPSQGAIALATYAMENQSAFIEKFVIKLLPKDAAATARAEDTDPADTLDPGLSELSEYFHAED